MTGQGDTVVITGANEGIGHHMLRTLLDDGYRVACLDIAGGNVEPLVESYPDRVRYAECDVTADEDVTRAIEGVLDEWGRVDILVNNAAVFEFDLLAEKSPESFRREFEVNYFGYLRLIRAVLPHMRERGGGIIHNVSSGVAATGHPGLSGYASTKAAIEALVRSLRLELRHENVACTLMYPPATNTRSAARLDYPEMVMNDPEDVGRKLARQVRSRDPVIYADLKTRLGLWLTERVPALVKRGTERFVERPE